MRKMRKDFVPSKMTKGKRKKMKGRADNNEDRGGHASIVPANADTFKISGPDDLRDELFPSIPNDVALQVIAPKLSVTDINTLSLLSRSWREAIHRRWVYDARVRSHSTETFVVLLSRLLSDGDTYKIRLYPLNGSSVYDLPPIPYPEEIRYGCKCIPMDGKIYILGGVSPGSKPRDRFTCSGSGEMFMLDLAGDKQWKQCASMQEGRLFCSGGVHDGKIYVVGGRNNRQSACKCEVYDPKVDAWSSIADLIPFRLEDRFASIGGEGFFYGGMECSEDSPFNSFPSRYAVAYNPVKNEWRQLGHFHGDERQNPWDTAFVAQGKFHTMTLHGTDVYDMDTNSWSNLHSFRHTSYYDEVDTWALDDEILTVSETHDVATPRDCLTQTKGFGKKNRNIAFEAVGSWRLRSDMCLMQL